MFQPAVFEFEPHWVEICIVAKLLLHLKLQFGVSNDLFS